MTYMTPKEQLLDSLYFLKGLYRLGLATTLLLSKEDTPNFLRTSHVIANQKDKLDFNDLAKFLEDKKTKSIILEQNNNVYLRSILLNSYELLWDFCEKHSKTDELKKQPWFKIVKILRNGLGHDLKYDLSNNSDDEFPMKIRYCVITKDMHGKPIKLDSIVGHNLSLDMIKFVKEKL